MNEENEQSIGEETAVQPFRYVRELQIYHAHPQSRRAQRTAFQKQGSLAEELSRRGERLQSVTSNIRVHSLAERMKEGMNRFFALSGQKAMQNGAMLTVGGSISLVLIILIGTFAMGGLVLLGGGTAASNDFYAPYVDLEYVDYKVPEKYLQDERFARMLSEAEKYLGYEYVWGGESPDTGFDCSGFVSWVINHSGNGWNIGRRTAEQLRRYCETIPFSEARPGDLIFLQGTYETAGASHVGIYVGDGMVLHCGNPIQYTDMNAFWMEHFLCVGRIPG